MIALSALVVAGAALWVLAPLLGWGATDAFASSGEGLSDTMQRRNETLKALKDLELEFEMGKLTREDYEQTRAQLSRQAVEIYKELDAQAPVHDSR